MTEAVLVDRKGCPAGTPSASVSWRVVGGYVLRRVLFTIPTLIGISLIIFFMVRLLPGDYIDILGGDF